jgi:hypothetical protein
MMYLQNSFTVPAAPEKISACEACVYGRGPHAPWCQYEEGKTPARKGKKEVWTPLPAFPTGVVEVLRVANLDSQTWPLDLKI